MHKSGLNAEVHFARLLRICDGDCTICWSQPPTGPGAPNSTGMGNAYPYHAVQVSSILDVEHVSGHLYVVFAILGSCGSNVRCTILYSWSSAHCQFAFGKVNAHMLCTYLAALLAAR